MGKKHLGAISLLLGGAAAVAAVVLTQWAPDPTDVSTPTGAAFYSRGNYGEALRIFRALADQGSARAQFNLGIMYANGHGVVQDDEQALKWYRLAADQKDVDAQNNLGVMYLQGRGVPQDAIRAHMWFALAAAAPTAQEAQAGTINRDRTATEMTPVQLSLSRDLTRRCQQQEYKDCASLAPKRVVASTAPASPARPQARRVESIPPAGPGSSANTPPQIQSPPPAQAQPQFAQSAPPSPPTRGRPYMPSRVSNVQLSASEVFQKVSPSVYVIFAAESVEDLLRDKPRTGSVGSAVAVSTDHVITNCHVVEGRSAIALLRDEEFGVAELAYADTSGDRCFLKSLDLVLHPVEGVRRYVDLSVGEQVYSIGTPRGYDLTLSDGLISALRSLSIPGNQGNHVQTNAPISPGSSGGGLFDARGNLIAITTLIRRDAQNLNFAVAADEFWR